MGEEVVTFFFKAPEGPNTTGVCATSQQLPNYNELFMLVFWVVMPCRIVGRYCLHIQSGMKMDSHEVRTQKTNINIFTTVRTLKLIS
jgi:hypothetical protein